MFVWWQQKQPPQQVPYTYAPRIGDDPSEPEVDEDHIRFQISTQVTTQDQPPQSAPGIGFVQEVTSREELYRNDQLIYRITRDKKEVAPTNQGGDWVDNHGNRSANMDTFTADRYVYTVEAELLPLRTYAPPEGKPALPPDGLMFSDFEPEFGPAADQALQDNINDNIPHTSRRGSGI